MSEERLRELRSLEADYFGQPLVVQQADLRDINRIRSELGLPAVNAGLKEIGAVVEDDAPQGPPAREEAPDHSEARAIYQAFLKKFEELEVHRAYAEEVARATSGSGQTPVRPLATMGTNGGPLLCDHCGKPIVLEGGAYHGIAADVAWKKNPIDDWASWILGGLVVEIQTNGTLRIYHGYPGRHANHCCNIASREHQSARAEFKSGKVAEKRPMMQAFVEHEFPDKTSDERLGLLNKILDTMYRYDPGIGVNRPGQER